MGYSISGRKVKKAEYDAFKKSGAKTYDEWKGKPKTTQTHDFRYNASGGRVDLAAGDKLPPGYIYGSRYERNQAAGGQGSDRPGSLKIDGKTVREKADTGTKVYKGKGIDDAPQTTGGKVVDVREPINLTPGAGQTSSQIQGDVREPITLLAKKQEKDKNILLKIAEAEFKILTSPYTTVALAATLAVLVAAGASVGALALRAGTTTGRAVINTIVSGHSVTATKLGGTRVVGRGVQTAQNVLQGVGGKIAPGLAKLLAQKKIITPKVIGMGTANLVKAGKTFSTASKMMVLAGAWASGVFLGKWGQAESSEPLSITMRDIMREAQRTGDWTLYDEAAAERDDILDLNMWEKIILWSPFSPFVGIPLKIRGAIRGSIAQDKLAEMLKIQSETGESEDEMWARIRQEQEEYDEKKRIENEEYYAKVNENIKRAKEEERKDDEEYWNKIERERKKDEARERKLEEEYWEEIRKLNTEIKKQEREDDAAYWDGIRGGGSDGSVGGGSSGGGGGTVGGTASAGGGTRFEQASNLSFGLLKSGGELIDEDEEEKKKKKKKK